MALPIAVQFYSVRDEAEKDFFGTLKKIKELYTELVAEHITVSEKTMEKYHAEHAESAKFVDGVDSFAEGQCITLFKNNVESIGKIYYHI